jgi:hypothetical protein
MTPNGKSSVTSTDPKNERSLATKEFRERMAKARGEFEESLQRSKDALAEADAALKIGSR